ncbi:CcdC family protein [uncultured Planococcus sp.]|uniref:CcdC family protein n=1 Tax=Planococcus donghaensis TaxID=414778 RepID=UPI002634FF09|nr:cytochrome c biogenesis protein CcdC [uncultured Planococcus sp.]
MLDQIPTEVYLIITTVGALAMGLLAMFVRSKSAKKPASVKKIILPPFFMSTGALMFIFPFFRVAPLQIFEALAVGILFSTVLIWTSKFEVRDGDIYLKQSKAFVFILFGLLLVRVIGKVVLSSSIDIGELGGMFWILAFGMLWPWRLTMLWQYKKIASKDKSAIPT